MFILATKTILKKCYESKIFLHIHTFVLYLVIPFRCNHANGHVLPRLFISSILIALLQIAWSNFCNLCKSREFDFFSLSIESSFVLSIVNCVYHSICIDSKGRSSLSESTTHKLLFWMIILHFMKLLYISFRNFRQYFESLYVRLFVSWRILLYFIILFGVNFRNCKYVVVYRQHKLLNISIDLLYCEIFELFDISESTFDSNVFDLSFTSCSKYTINTSHSSKILSMLSKGANHLILENLNMYFTTFNKLCIFLKFSFFGRLRKKYVYILCNKFSKFFRRHLYASKARKCKLWQTHRIIF